MDHSHSHSHFGSNMGSNIQAYATMAYGAVAPIFAFFATIPSEALMSLLIAVLPPLVSLATYAVKRYFDDERRQLIEQRDAELARIKALSESIAKPTLPPEPGVN